MNLTEFKARLKSDKRGGFYIFGGEEDYLKTFWRGELLKATRQDDAFDMFNYVLVDGDEFSVAALEELVATPPMMADYKVIEWRHANLDKLPKDTLERLCTLAEEREEHPECAVIITALEGGFETTEKRPSKLHTTLEKSGFSVLVFDRSTDVQLLSWLKKHFDTEGIATDPETLSAMLFRVGHSMAQLNEEVTKLSAYAKANGMTRVGIREVEQVCSATVECEAFALSNAIIEKNTEKAFLALSDMKQQRIEPYIVLAQLSRTYSELLSISLLIDEGRDADAIASLMKFHPYRLSLYMRAAKKLGTRRLSDTLSHLIRVDTASKMGGIGGFGAIEMFITQNI